MNKEEFVKAFSEMSPEDQEAIKAEIIGKITSQEGQSCCTGPMKDQLADMMKKMETSENPMAMWLSICRETFRRKTVEGWRERQQHARSSIAFAQTLRFRRISTTPIRRR